MEYIGRNTVWGFRERVLKNLSYLGLARQQGADVHVVTELITSLLGLIVFPFEEINRSGRYGRKPFNKYRLDELSGDGWPAWKFELSSSVDLDDLICHLRNAISHRRVSFSSDSRILSSVEVRFADAQKSSQPEYWAATINAAELHRFVTFFADLLDQLEREFR